MRNKIIAGFILVSLILPSFSFAFIAPSDPLPQANLTIIIDTQEDSFFKFDISTQNNANLDYYFSFIDQTENLHYSREISLAPVNRRYFLEKNVVEGGETKYIQCSSNNPNTAFGYILSGGRTSGVAFIPNENENIICTFSNIKTVTPILIVPGLVGTELKEGNELLWADIPRMANPLNTDSFMDPLQFDDNLRPIDGSVSAGDILKNPFNLFNYSNALIQELIDQGYVENQTLFTFPYDWRYGVSGKYANEETNVDLLQRKIADIMTQTGADKVDVVAHSMGGLIVKQYVANHVANNHIGKAVFVGVPSTGAPYAVKDLLVGDNIGVIGLNDAEIKKISENMPAIYDLLPSQKYYDVKGSYVRVIDQGFTGLFSTVKDLTHQEANSFLTVDHGLNAVAVANAESLHTLAFDDFDMRSTGIDLYAIDGCRAGTLAKITEVRSKTLLGFAKIDYKQPVFLPGDGTVPLESSTNLPIDQSKKYYALTNLNSPITGEDLIGVHGHLLSNEGVRQEIVNLISGSNLAVDSKVVTQDIAKCNLNGKAISVYSPIDISVIDQQGNHLGLADDGSVMNEIPNAAFEIWGDPASSADMHKFLYLPTDDGQTYTVAIKGTGTGTYTITTQDIVDNQPAGGQVFSNLPVTPELSGTINLAAQATLTVRPASGGADQIVTASATLDATGTQDILPPSSTVTVSGSQDADNNYTGDAVITINATDASSGVLAVHYNLDSTGLQTVAGASATVTVSAEGAHELLFFGTDNAGNNEAPQTITFSIKKPAPPVVVPSPAPVPPASSGGGGSAAASLLLTTRQPESVPVVLPPAPQTAPPPVEDEKLITPPAPPNPAPVVVRKRVAPTAPVAVAVELKKPAPPELPPVPPAPAKETPNIFLASLKNVSDWIARLLFGR